MRMPPCFQVLLRLICCILFDAYRNTADQESVRPTQCLLLNLVYNTPRNRGTEISYSFQLKCVTDTNASIKIDNLLKKRKKRFSKIAYISQAHKIVALQCRLIVRTLMS